MKVKKISSVLVLLLCLVFAGCSSDSATTPQAQLTTITAMLAKGYQMADQERQRIDGQVKQARELMQEGNSAEAGKILARVLADLEVLAESDRFNKSE